MSSSAIGIPTGALAEQVIALTRSLLQTRQ